MAQHVTALQDMFCSEAKWLDQGHSVIQWQSWGQGPNQSSKSILWHNYHVSFMLNAVFTDLLTEGTREKRKPKHSFISIFKLRTWKGLKSRARTGPECFSVCPITGSLFEAKIRCALYMVSTPLSPPPMITPEDSGDPFPKLPQISLWNLKKIKPAQTTVFGGSQEILHYQISNMICVKSKIFSPWWQSDSKYHFILKTNPLSPFLYQKNPLQFQWSIAWDTDTCLRQEVFLSASCRERDPWSQPQIFPRWHLYWRTHPVAGQMFLAEVQE